MDAEEGGKKDSVEEGTREMVRVFFCIGEGGESDEDVEEGERDGSGGSELEAGRGEGEGEKDSRGAGEEECDE